jgi:hypothetical protein
MKPVERLNGVLPEDLVLIHETGHAVLGHALNLNEGGIEFFVDDPFEVARAHWQELGASTAAKTIRSLAGIYIQSKVIPDSVTEPLRERLFQGLLVLEESELETSFGELLKENRCSGDWAKITEAFDRERLSQGRRFELLNQSIEDLRRIVTEGSLVQTCELVAEDIKTWLNTEDEEIKYALMIVYPMIRSREVFLGNRN